MPAVALAAQALSGSLGANPIAETIDATGELAVKLLLLSLACTPARIVTGAAWPMRARKHLGLLAFAYASLHLGVYVGLDRLGALASLATDVLERPFVAVGMGAFALLLPLALTSSAGMVRRLGGRRWSRLHRLVYVVAVLAIVHFVMRAKKDVTEAAAHGAVLGLLLAVRVVDALRRRSARARSS